MYDKFMKKKRGKTYILSLRWKKILNVMRLTCLLTLWLTFSATASVFSQREVTLDMKSGTLSQVLRQIKDQTGVKILWQEDLLREAGCGELHLHRVNVEEALRQVLAGTRFEYVLSEGVIVIREKESVVPPKDLIQIRGKVTDQQGEPLPGVTIRLKGTELGTSTDVNGIFRFTVPDLQQTLVFTFVGMKAQEVKLEGRNELVVVMQETASEMEEVVVTGYSSRKISEMTGAVQQFKGKDVASSAVGGNLMNALRGHTTGLQITGSNGTPGSDGELLLRGVGTLYSENTVNTSSSTPLIVIDGVITDYTSISGVVAASDIADITVLKDAASTAIYGSRAATGVIVVTTKKGVKDKMSVTLDMKMGVNVSTFGGLKYMNSRELLEYGEMSLRNWYDNSTSLQGKYANREQFVQDTLRRLKNNFDMTKTTDWRDLAYRTGQTQDVALSIRGGGDKMQYYFSYNYFDEAGTKIGYDLTRHLFKVRMDFDVTEFLTFGVNLNGSFEKNISPNSGEIQGYHPWLSPWNENGDLKYNIPRWTNFVISSDPKANPLLDNRYNDQTVLKNNLFGSFSGTLKPFKWLSVSSTNTFTLQNQNINDYQDSRTYSGNNYANKESNGTLRIEDSRNWSFLTSNLLRLQHSFGRHALNGLIGQEWYERHSRSSEIQMYDQSTAGERNVGGFTKQGRKGDEGSVPTGDEAESGSFSVFSEINYNYDGRYMASASFRTDGSTNFGKDNRYGTFYSVSASWLVSREKFMAGQKLFSNLKLRLSYGTSGKEAGMDYLNYTLYTTGMTTFDYYRNHPAYQSSYAAEMNQLGNDQLSWETAHNLNAGIDLGLWNNRIALSVDAYQRRNSDLIMPVALAAAYGVGRQYRNIGEMKNKGIEIILNTHTIQSPDFNWYTNFTFSYNKNKLTRLDQGQLSRDSERTLYEGENIDVLKLVKFIGVDPETGKAQLQKIDKDGNTEVVNYFREATAGNGEYSYVDCGLSRAPYWGGFTNTFTYKNWELYVHTVYSFGNKVFNSTKVMYTNGRAWMNNNLYRLPSAWKMWQKQGDRADIPVLNADPAINQDLGNRTSFAYQNGKFWKISQLRVAYNFPQTWLKTLHLQQAALNFTCDNLYTVTSRKFVGSDPETINGWSAPRRFILGLNVTF